MDDDIRELERRAALDDEEAKLRLAHARCRAGQCCGHRAGKLAASCLLSNVEVIAGDVEFTDDGPPIGGGSMELRGRFHITGNVAEVVTTLRALQELGVVLPDGMLTNSLSAPLPPQARWPYSRPRPAPKRRPPKRGRHDPQTSD